jgi:hypothetical protein
MIIDMHSFLPIVLNDPEWSKIHWGEEQKVGILSNLNNTPVNFVLLQILLIISFFVESLPVRAPVE